MNNFNKFERNQKTLPINISDESNQVFARVSSPSVIMVPEYPLQKVNITKPERKRSSNKKSSWASSKCRVIFENILILITVSLNDTVLPLTEMGHVPDKNYCIRTSELIKITFIGIETSQI